MTDETQMQDEITGDLNDEMKVNEEPTVDATEASAEETSVEALLEKARQEAAEYLDGWQRARAELANYRKRVERERDTIAQTTTFEVLGRFLPVFDDFELALENIPADMADHGWVTGIALIRQKFEKLLKEHAIVEINPLGEAFDPNLHQAVGMDDSADGIESGHITTVVQKGYAQGEKLLRPALVRVAS